MKPGDFLLGVLDFFAVLLPGSLIAWLATQYVPPDTFTCSCVERPVRVVAT